MTMMSHLDSSAQHRAKHPLWLAPIVAALLIGCGDGEGAGTDVGVDAPSLAVIDCPSTCDETLPAFCASSTITAACATHCAEENAAIDSIGATCQAAYEAWFACVIVSFETVPAGTCSSTVGWYETHELPASDAVCFAELSAFASACELLEP